MFKRLHEFYVRCYEHMMMALTRHGPKDASRSDEKPLNMPWEPGDEHHCPYCIWLYLIWSEERQDWHCSHCSLLLRPALSITEKRPALLPPPKAVQVVHLDPNTGKPMRLSVAYKRKTIDLGKWVQDRPVWKDTGREVNTGELLHVRFEDRRTR